MTQTQSESLRCDIDNRRAALLSRRRNGLDITGIDYVEVSTDQLSINVYFIDAPPPLGLVGRPERIRVIGGRRIKEVRVLDVSSALSGGRTHLVVTVNQPGDFSNYVLEIDRLPELDELYRRVEFNFKANCPSRFDCRPSRAADEPGLRDLDIDYLAKDYASFRHALVDLIPRLSPQWTERLAADLGMTVLELLVYAADQLSYYQDAVANEAFLETARQRISVRRHARLIDYHMHDGAASRTIIHFKMHDGVGPLIVDPAGKGYRPFELLTRIREPIGSEPPNTVIASDDRERAEDLAEAVFQTFSGGCLHSLLNEVTIYDWGNSDCALPAGTVSADLIGDFADVLKPGDLLLFEEVRDPGTGDKLLADPNHRQVVRVTGVELVQDKLTNKDLTRISWDRADALAFTLCVTAVDEDGARIEDVSVARGNLLVADHGRTFTEKGLSRNAIASGTRTTRFSLERGPLSFRIPLPGTDSPAAGLFDVDPGAAEPQIDVDVSSKFPSDDWKPVRSLIGSDRFDHHFAVETDNNGRAQLRFGDNVFGMAPPQTATFDVTYRVGIGPEGNVGPEAIQHVIGGPHVPDCVVDGQNRPCIAHIRNPLPAWGGRAAESTTRIKRVAPAAFRALQERAVTEADYAEVAERHALVNKAVARFRWTGSWHTVFISIDPKGRLDLPPEHTNLIKRHVESFTQADYDLKIVPPHYVPLRLNLEICVDPAHLGSDVEQAVRETLTSGRRPDGLPGFFHPDKFTFGQPLYLSALYAAVASVDGAESVVATRFARLSDDETGPLGPFTKANLDQGEISIGLLEILRLDDDPDFPENGLLQLVMQGGK